MDINFTLKEKGFVSNLEIGKLSDEVRISSKTFLPKNKDNYVLAYVMFENGEYVPAIQMNGGFYKGKDAGYQAKMVAHAYREMKFYADDMNDFQRESQQFIYQICHYLECRAKEGVALYLPLMPTNLSAESARTVIAKIAGSPMYSHLNLTETEDVARLDENTMKGLIFVAESIEGVTISEKRPFSSMADFIKSVLETKNV